MTTTDLHARMDGPEGAPVLLLSNSLGTALEVWDGQMDAFTRSFRVLRYDTRGHGRSPVLDGPYKIDDLGRDVVELMDRFAVERASFCGLSLGGLTGMWLASSVPERLDHLVLCCTAERFAPADTWIERARAVRSDGMEAVADVVIDRWFTQGFRSSSADTVDTVRRMLLSTPSEGYARCCEALIEADLSDGLGSIAAPTLVIGGLHDPVSPPDKTRELAAAIPSGRAELLDAAHLANVERPAQFTSAVLDHLTRADVR
jgi:3-oxoadipate enol-lactonase